MFVLIVFTFGLHFKFFPVLLYCILLYICSISLIQTSNYASIHSICWYVPLYWVWFVSLYSPAQHSIYHAFQLSETCACLLVLWNWDIFYGHRKLFSQLCNRRDISRRVLVLKCHIFSLNFFICIWNYPWNKCLLQGHQVEIFYSFISW